MREDKLQRVHDGVRKCWFTVTDGHAVDRPRAHLVQHEITFLKRSAQVVDAPSLRHQWCGSPSCGRNGKECSAAACKCCDAEQMENLSPHHRETQLFGQ